jgi:hypothetical protein
MQDLRNHCCSNRLVGDKAITYGRSPGVTMWVLLGSVCGRFDPRCVWCFCHSYVHCGFCDTSPGGMGTGRDTPLALCTPLHMAFTSDPSDSDPSPSPAV